MTNPTETLTLTEFLEQRIAEDEAAARSSLIEAAYFQFGNTAAEALLGLAESEGAQQEALDHFSRHDPARVLAECAAKRLILTLHEDYMSDVRAYRSPSWQDVEDDTNRVDRLKAEARGRVSSDAVQALAQVYGDHPDFRDGWRWENR